MGRDMGDIFRLTILAWRGLEGSSSKKLPTLGDDLSEGDMTLLTGGFNWALGRGGTGG